MSNRPSNKQRLEKLLHGSIDSKLEDYYYIYVNPFMNIDDDIGKFFVQKDGRDYYKITMKLQYNTFKKDESRLKGIQARLLFAVFNSISSFGFDNYPAETSVCVNSLIGYSARLKDIFSLVTYLDKGSNSAVRLTAYPLPNGFSQFAALMNDKEAVFAIHGGLPGITIKHLLKPFLKSSSKPADPINIGALIADYIKEDYNLNHNP